MVALEPLLTETEQDAKLSRDVWHLGRADEAIVRELVENHARHTGSAQARRILADWSSLRAKFVKVFPHEYRRALGELAAKSKKLAA
jgi:glutamate synthase domain-containing protein 3